MNIFCALLHSSLYQVELQARCPLFQVIGWDKLKELQKGQRKELKKAKKAIIMATPILAEECYSDEDDDFFGASEDILEDAEDVEGRVFTFIL